MSAADLVGRLVTGLQPPDRDPAGWADRPVDEEEVAALLAAARVAPSADNLQTWRFIVVRQPEGKGRLAGAVPSPLASCLAKAPVVLVACGVRGLFKQARREQPFALVDVPIAVSHMLLQAVELGLHCAWTLDPMENKVREVLGAPGDVRVVAVLALGWPPAGQK
jgi:nitroreductase